MDKLQPGQMLGTYRIISQIGEGGMATVYKAYQLSMDRNVAIKVLPGQLAQSEEFVKRFQQEARIIARLEHPFILPVFDYGEENGIAYFVMRYLEAGTLKDKMNVGQLPLDEIDRIFTQLADALGYAHAHGVVHRDLKPANALVDSEGNLFLTDFGIAKLLESASPRLTQTSAIMGTPAYISPEQAAANPVDQRSDIYSLGVILYEMVTGRVPFVADTPLAVILKHLKDPLPPPSTVKSDIPPFIEQVIVKALAKDPDDRFNNTAEFVAAWKRALAGLGAKYIETEKISTPPPRPASTVVHTQGKPAPATQTLSKSGSSATGLVIGCVVIICLLAAAVGAFGFASSLMDQPSSPTATSIPAATDTLAPTVIPTIPAKVILEDDFSKTNVIWGTLTDSDSSIEYSADTLRVIIYTGNWFVWTGPNDVDYENVHAEVTVTNNDTDQYTAFGLMCNQQSDADSYYYFAITPAGQYVIAKTATGETDIFLTNNNNWEYSNLINRNASTYRVGADCGANGKLTLYVDGQEIDSATDTSYTRGGLGLIVWSAEDANKTDVSFDDFLVTDIP